jgi:hypothetical protein
MTRPENFRAPCVKEISAGPFWSNSTPPTHLAQFEKAPSSQWFLQKVIRVRVKCAHETLPQKYPKTFTAFSWRGPAKQD